jgi:peptide/nickel transport system permease protein
MTPEAKVLSAKINGALWGFSIANSGRPRPARSLQWGKRAGRLLFSAALTIVCAGALAATLVRVAPGFGTDELELDGRLSAASVASLRREGRQDLATFYVTFAARAIHGDLGESKALARPVAELLRERAAPTARAVFAAVGIAWMAAVVSALGVTSFRARAGDRLLGVAAGLLLCLPPPVMALALAWTAGMPPSWSMVLVLSAVVFPRIYTYARAVLGAAWLAPHAGLAQARGCSRGRVALRHVAAPQFGPLLAAAAVSISAAFGAAIPAEVVCDWPGLGQLAWQAALARDLQLLVWITLAVSTVAVGANTLADALGGKR